MVSYFNDSHSLMLTYFFLFFSLSLSQTHNCTQKMERFPSAVTSARHVEFRDTIQWNKFADGFPNLFIEDVRYMAGKDGE